MTEIRLCSIKEIPPGECKGFSLTNSEEQDMLIVNRNNRFYAYTNNCPHTTGPLNWQDDVFMDLENFYIMCSIHGARFEVETGLCVWGPCAKRSLTPVKIKIEDEQIFLMEDVNRNKK